MITNIDDLSHELTEDLTWRRREISSLLSSVQLAGLGDRPTLLRATMVMIYAHWEGYVKGAASRLLEFISSKRLPYGSLSNGIFYLSVESIINRISNSSRKDSVELLSEMLEKRNQPHRSRFSDQIKTSNLRFDVLLDICAVCGLSATSFSKDDGIYLDKKICDARNAVAHGRNSTITYDDLVERRDFVFKLIEAFKTLIENHVATEEYRMTA